MKKKNKAIGGMIVACLVLGLIIWDRDVSQAEQSFVEKAANNYMSEVQAELSNGMDVEVRGEYGETALIAASYRGHMQLAEFLLRSGADPNATDDNGSTALHGATANGHLEIVKLLLAYHAQPNVADKTDGRYPMIDAAMMGTPEMIQVLAEGGASLNVSTKNGRTALHWAVDNLRTENVRFLVNNGANLRPIDNTGKTALDYAKEKHHDEIIQLLEQ
ncbi:ankyrin repeat protein [Tumebacillus sp. BK434]|uniref:ankyrin repeat domain-containing protein n=1 Tax=Tumebacillus sp. BK434 TaxID=2512169 RepID=UPI0010F2299B|nr:ankyrin repeat domain-containing protein [Tumebacillus sp. BK434]TCP59137.1 ankyrin repeat protein [Tumebacillus sp. BK434]